MRAKAICISKMGHKQVELVDVFPKGILSEEQKDFVQKNSLPYGATEGNYFSVRMNNEGEFLFSYVFVVHSTINNQRNIIAAIASIVEDQQKILVDKIHEERDEQKDFVRKSFSFVISKLNELGILSLPTIIQIIPSIFDGLESGHFTININSEKIIDFNFGKKIEHDNDEITRETMRSELF